MAVCAILRVTWMEAFEKVPYALGLQAHAKWWRIRDEDRRVFSFGKVAQIDVVAPGYGNESDLSPQVFKDEDIIV